MLPITDLLSCTEPINEFESLSPEQQHHAKTYTTGLVAASNKTVAGIAREVIPAQGKRAVNKFLTEYDWDEDQVNHERLEELQKHGETRWSQDGYIILDDSVNHKTGKELPGVGRFYDHAEGETVWGQNLVYAFYADEKTAYPLAFRLYDDDDDRTKYDLAREIITELEDEVGVPADTYLMDSWFTHDSNLIDHIESYDKDWIGPLRSNRQVTYGGEEIRVDALAERIDTVEREIDDETYKIWTQKRSVSELGEVRLLIAEKVTEEEDDENPVRYFASNKIGAPSEHLIRSYSFRWPVEVFFEDSKQDLGFGDCEVRDEEVPVGTGTSRCWPTVCCGLVLNRAPRERSARKRRRSKSSWNTL